MQKCLFYKCFGEYSVQGSDYNILRDMFKFKLLNDRRKYSSFMLM